jgi:hypothetical protein
MTRKSTALPYNNGKPLSTTSYEVVFLRGNFGACHGICNTARSVTRLRTLATSDDTAVSYEAQKSLEKLGIAPIVMD